MPDLGLDVGLAARSIRRRQPHPDRRQWRGYRAETRQRLQDLLADTSSAPVIDYHAPDGSVVNRPPIWITAVGRGGFWPVAFEPHYDDHGYVRLARDPLSDGLPPSLGTQGPPGFILAFLGVDLLVAFFVALYFWGRSPILGFSS